jgi:hypothetical protein
MHKKFVLAAAAILVLGSAIAACGNHKVPAPQTAATLPAQAAPTRGVFGPDACDIKSQVPLGTRAAYAVYLDSDGNLLDAPAEDLTGTSGNLMCPTPPPDSNDPNNPAACKQGYCPRLVSGRQFCMRC